MKLQLTRSYAVIIGLLGIAGLFVNGHLFGLMNVDIALDALRIVLAAYLVYAGFIDKSEKSTGLALDIVGVLYIGMALIGLVSPTFGGLLPSGLTGFDIIFHLVTGGLALFAGVRRNVNTRVNA